MLFTPRAQNRFLDLGCTSTRLQAEISKLAWPRRSHPARSTRVYNVLAYFYADYFDAGTPAPSSHRLGGSEQKKRGGRNADSLRTARSASVQQYKWRSNLPRIWPHLRVLVASAWRKLTDGHSQVANPVFFSLGVCENNISLFFLSLAKLCRLKFAFTEQEKWQRRRWPRAPLTDDFHHSRENTPSCMADEEALVLARIILDHLVIWSAFT